ncbi:hypothetical protein D3C81_2110650 [compost metagenome]
MRLAPFHEFLVTPGDYQLDALLAQRGLQVLQRQVAGHIHLRHRHGIQHQPAQILAGPLDGVLHLLFEVGGIEEHHRCIEAQQQ